MRRIRFYGIALSALTLAVTAPANASVSFIAGGFEGVDALQLKALAGGLAFPPDTMGAVGKTQFVEYLNGTVSIYDKSTGFEQSAISAQDFWKNAGAIATNGYYDRGDPRILYNAQAQRWIAASINADLRSINLAVSNTSDANGVWQATKFAGYPDALPDFPTLALDLNSVYIGTNDFSKDFLGTTLNVIPIGDIFKANLGAPTTVNNTSFFTPVKTFDHGFGAQGVNNNQPDTLGHVVAGSLVNRGVAYNINTAGRVTHEGPVTLLNVQPFNLDLVNRVSNGKGRQPDGSRNLDIGRTTRTSSSVWEQNGKIYFVRTVTPLDQNNVSTDHAVVRITVLDAATFDVVQEEDIDGGLDFDVYEGSIAVSAFGAVVGYNRSGFDAATGAITFLANAYTFDGGGKLIFDATHLLKQSVVDGYHLSDFDNRNRWGDYSAVTVDPTNARRFFAVGEYARRGTPDFDVWGTYIGEIGFEGGRLGGVPEPANWAMMVAGFGLAGGAIRRRPQSVRFETS